MKENRRKKWKPFFWYFGAWAIALILFDFIRQFGVGSMLKHPELDNFFLENLGISIFFIFIEAFIAALFYTKIAQFVFSPKFRRKSYFYIIANFSAIHLAGFIAVTFVLIIVSIFLERPDHSFLEFTLNVITNKDLFVILIYSLFIGDILICATLITNRFGQGVLLNIMLGKYHRPQEQDRIFMFLDLKSSTSYAEKLGHIRYSEMIQDCFYDLTDSIDKHDVEIYQYVGDEAVLTWNVEKGLIDNNCIEAFYTFQEIIKRKKDYYIEKYGIVPEFKAGVNMGKVTVAEVGVIKREIAYHSDVLNTASRIQGKCNDFGHNILISGMLREQIKNTRGLVTDLMGNIILKGKKKTVDVYAVSKA
ncbi:adenylate/guanylate cyclase domain-containing protein [Thermodesulfobacteriota bacterium]